MTQIKLMKESQMIAPSVAIADTLLSRTKGLLGRPSLPAGEGLWIKRCNSIHTLFMRFSLDAVFVDKNLRVVSIHQNLPPWRITLPRLKATSVFEMPAGTLNELGIHLQAGDQLTVVQHGQ
ncbi:MAG: DUF192 domain-containing protein [Bdellovibrionales bacterium]|jgi:uncharacterized membrane protein (UPF0127 family)|nr:DUF192 domain-containing protein [Bdellovibrionales bacterium]